MKNFAELWYKKHILLYALLPFSYVYRLIIFLRSYLYRIGWLKSQNFSLPVIVVGNITLGGTGKTPLVIELANFLKRSGYHPGIVSRGYGGKAAYYPQWVDAQSDPKEVGDEALLLARHTQCPVVVAPKRSLAVAQLTQADVDVIVCDDGLQHYALHRDIEIALIDGDRRFGNGFCFPAGPLREPRHRLQKVDYLITNGQAKENEFSMRLESQGIYNLLDTNQAFLTAATVKKPVHAIAGIGNPERFFNSLRQLNFQVIEHRFPDHYQFEERDLNFAQDDIVIMTEKDAVKCRKFAKSHFWVLPVEVKLDKRFLQLFLQDVMSIHQRYASSNFCN